MTDQIKNLWELVGEARNSYCSDLTYLTRPQQASCRDQKYEGWEERFKEKYEGVFNDTGLAMIKSFLTMKETRKTRNLWQELDSYCTYLIGAEKNTRTIDKEKTIEELCIHDAKE